MKAFNFKLVSLVLILLFTFFAAGCSSTEKQEPAPEPGTKATEKPAESAATPEQKYEVTILGGSAGGMWSVITEGVAESIRRGLSTNARITTEPGKDGPNQSLVNKGEVEFAVGYEATAMAAINGLEPYAEKHNDLMAVAVLSPIMPFQFFVDAKTGLKSFSDLSQKKYPLKMSGNKKGSMMEIVTRKVLEAHDASYDNIKKWGGKIEYLPATEALATWDTGLLEAVGEVAQYPLSAYVEFAMKHKLGLLPITDEAILKKLSADLGMTTLTIPANTYTFQPEPVPALNTQLLLLVNKNLDEKTVYDIVKSMHSNLSYLNNVHSSLKTLDGKAMAQTSISLHPGAIKFYKEAGFLN